MLTTKIYGFKLPEVGSVIDEDQWGNYLNSNWQNLDDILNIRQHNLDFSGYELKQPKLNNYCEKLYSAGTIEGDEKIDFEQGNHFEAILIGDVTFSFNNPPKEGSIGIIILYLTQDDVGARKVNWPSNVKWAGGSEPTLSSEPNFTDELVFITKDAGKTYTGSVRGIGF